MSKQKAITARIADALIARVVAATDRRKDPYAPTKTQLIERGLELALQELEKKPKKKK